MGTGCRGSLEDRQPAPSPLQGWEVVSEGVAGQPGVQVGGWVSGSADIPRVHAPALSSLSLGVLRRLATFWEQQDTRHLQVTASETVQGLRVQPA